MTAWSHLPNATHIDRVLAHLKAHPERWSAAWNAARGAAWNAAWNAARGNAGGNAGGAAGNATWNAVRDAARSAVSALTAYDDAAIFLSQTPEHLRTLYRIDPHPMFLLLQPAAIALSSDETKP